MNKILRDFLLQLRYISDFYFYSECIVDIYCLILFLFYSIKFSKNAGLNFNLINVRDK